MVSKRNSNAVAVAEAVRLWRLYGFATPQELVLEDLAMAMGVFVVDAPLQSAVARLVRRGEYGLVRVSDSLRSRGRRRFAIAHELGHFVLHKKVDQLLSCTESDVLAAYQSNGYELEASAFAGALLMPETHFVERAATRSPNAETLRDLSSYFDSSLTATAFRFVETTSDYCVLVVSEAGRIRWWRESRSFEHHNLWLDNRTAVPRYSAAAAYFRDGAVPIEPIEVDLADWFGNLKDFDCDYVMEQAIALPDFDQVISMIWLP